MSLGDTLDSRIEKMQQSLDEAQGDIEDLKDRITELEAKLNPPDFVSDPSPANYIPTPDDL